MTGAVDQLAGPLRPGTTRQWTVTVPAATLGFASGFGVYPLAAQLDSAGQPLADAYTFLPFWPGSARAAGLTRPEQVAWIWPLIGQPEQAACHSLLNDGLATSLASTGRLGGLLTDGTSPAGVAAQLTWAIDPSLLSSAALMTHPYRVGGTPTCTGTRPERASPAAEAWLAKVHALARQQDFFTTPYADVDVSALAHAGLDSDVARALAKGREVAAGQSQLGAVQRPAGPRIDWPADGIADYGVLGSLAANQIGTVVLSSSMMPPAHPVLYTPSAITSTPDGVNAGLRVALADSTLTQVLADAPTAASPVGRCRHTGGGGVRHRAAVPGRDRDDRGRAARPAPVRGRHPAPAVEPGAGAGQRAADRDGQRALAAAGQPEPPAGQALHQGPGAPQAAPAAGIRPR